MLMKRSGMRCEIMWRDKLHIFMLWNSHLFTEYIHIWNYIVRRCFACKPSCNCRLFDIIQFILIIILIVSVVVVKHIYSMKYMTTCYILHKNHMLKTLAICHYIYTKCWIVQSKHPLTLALLSLLFCRQLKCEFPVKLDEKDGWHSWIWSATAISCLCSPEVICFAIWSFSQCNGYKQTQRCPEEMRNFSTQTIPTQPNPTLLYDRIF